jgi:hypothetical protein
MGRRPNHLRRARRIAVENCPDLHFVQPGESFEKIAGGQHGHPRTKSQTKILPNERVNLRGTA